METTAKILNYTRKEIDLSQEDFARLLFTTARTVARWESGQNAPNKLVMMRIYELNDLFEYAKQILKPEKVHQWFTTPNPAFGGSTPSSVLDLPRGIEKVKDLLGKIEWGLMP